MHILFFSSIGIHDGEESTRREMGQQIQRFFPFQELSKCLGLCYCRADIKPMRGIDDVGENSEYGAQIFNA